MKTAKKLGLGACLLMSLAVLGAGAAQALTSNSPSRVACPDYPSCQFGGTQYYCCDPV